MSLLYSEQELQSFIDKLPPLAGEEAWFTSLSTRNKYLNAVAMKECVSHIDVVEISQDVIDLVLPHYSALYPGKIECHCASIFDWKPAKGVVYDMAWFDIWNDLCTDNLKAMEQLHRKFARKAKWKGSWGKSHLQWHLKRFGW